MPTREAYAANKEKYQTWKGRTKLCSTYGTKNLFLNQTPQLQEN